MARSRRKDYVAQIQLLSSDIQQNIYAKIQEIDPSYKDTHSTRVQAWEDLRMIIRAFKAKLEGSGGPADETEFEKAKNLLASLKRIYSAILNGKLIVLAITSMQPLPGSPEADALSSIASFQGELKDFWPLITKHKEMLDNALPSNSKLKLDDKQHLVVVTADELGDIQLKAMEKILPLSAAAQPAAPAEAKSPAAAAPAPVQNFRQQMTDYLSRITDLNDPEQRALLNGFAVAEATVSAKLNKAAGYAVPREEANEIIALGQAKFKELAPAHIINNLHHLSAEQLGHLLATESRNQRREKINEFQSVLGINLQGHTTDQAIISDDQATEIRTAVEAEGGQRFLGTASTIIPGAAITDPEKAKMLADLAMAAEHRGHIREAVRKHKNTWGISTLRDNIMTGRTHFLPETKATDGLAESAGARLHDAIQAIMPNITHSLDLSGNSNEIKKITDLAIANQAQLDNVRRAIAPLKARLGALNNFEPNQIESKHVVSDANTTAIQNSVRLKIQALVQEQCQRTIGVKREIDLLKLTELARRNSDQAIRDFIAHDNNRAFFGLDNFEEAALQNPQVINNPTGIRQLAIDAVVNLGLAALNNASAAIQAKSIDNQIEAVDLATLAVSTDARATVVLHKDRIGLQHVAAPIIEDPNGIFAASEIERLQTEARTRIQAEMTRKVEAGIQALTAANDNALLETLATGTDAAIRNAIAADPAKFGLTLDPAHIQDNNVIPLGTMTREFNALAVARRTEQSPEGKIALAALANLQAELDSTAITPAYKNLRDTFWNSSPGHKKALLLFTSEFNKQEDESTRITRLTALLRPLFDSSSTLTEIETQSSMMPPTHGGGDLASAIYHARIAEKKAQQIKTHVVELTDRHQKINEMLTKAEDLHIKAKTAAGQIRPQSSPEAKKKLDETVKTRAARNELRILVKAAENAMQEAKDAFTRLNRALPAPAGARSGTPPSRPKLTAANALAISQSAFNRIPNAVAEAEEQLQKAKDAHSVAVAQPRAPQLEPIPQEIIDAKGRPLSLCNIVENTYSRISAFILAAESGDTRALDDLDKLMTEATDFKTRIGEAKTAIKNSTRDKVVTEKATEWLQKAERNIDSLKIELAFLKKNKDGLRKDRVRVFPNGNVSYTKDQLRDMNTTDLTTHQSWLDRVVKIRASAGSQAIFHARHNGHNEALFTDAAKPDALASYRHYPPGEPTYDQLVCFEKETRPTPGSSDVTYELVGQDLPIKCSDRGALVKFLEDRGLAGAKDIVFASDKLHPVLTKEAILSFFATTHGLNELATPKIVDDFMKNDLKKYRTQKVALPDKFENKTNPRDKKTLDEYLKLPFEVRQQYKAMVSEPLRPSFSTIISAVTFFRGHDVEVIPSEAIFAAAAETLALAASKDKLPLEFIQFDDKQLLLAMSFYVKEMGLSVKFPESATLMTDNQMKAASLMNYQAMYREPKKVATDVHQASAEIEKEVASFSPKPRS